MTFVSRLQVTILSKEPKDRDSIAKWTAEARETERRRILDIVLNIIPREVAEKLRRVLEKDPTLWQFSGEDDVPLCDTLDARWYVSPSNIGIGYLIELAKPNGLWTIEEAKHAERLLALKHLHQGGEVTARLVDEYKYEDTVAENVQTANLLSGRHWSSGLT